LLALESITKKRARASVRTGKMRVLLFAAARERAGAAELELALAKDARARDVIAAAVAACPALGGLAAVLRVAVDQEFVDADHAIGDARELALLPPVSGGAGHLRDEALDAARLIAQVRDDGHGAIATFLGVVRDHSHGKRVHRLDYEAYRPMAERAIAAVVDAVRTRHPSARVAIEHRLGSLVVGEVAVVVVAAAPHRQAALAACAEAIDEVKARAPIWKREHTDEGASWVGCADHASHVVS
jgi:molybdopterin synthase catalytic subunit